MLPQALSRYCFDKFRVDIDTQPAQMRNIRENGSSCFMSGRNTRVCVDQLLRVASVEYVPLRRYVGQSSVEM